MGKKIVVGSDLKPSWSEEYGGVLGEFFKQVFRGIEQPGKGLSPDQIQAVNEHRSSFEPRKEREKGALIETAVKILGSHKIITPAQAASASGLAAFQELSTRYLERTIEKCAKVNLKSGADWRLVATMGLSLREQCKIYGTDTKKQPCFYRESTWWLKKEQDPWTTLKPWPEMRLLDFTGRYPNTPWHLQDVSIATDHPNCERAHEAVVTEAAFSNFLYSGRWLLEGWYHWGVSLTFGCPVYVGPVDGSWFIGNLYGLGDGTDSLRVVLFRKFDF